jgi:hypothetical protein
VRILTAVAAATLVGLLFVLAWPPGRIPPVPGEVLTSVLAVGDTGETPEPTTGRRQLLVAAALAAEDRRQRADALVLLGDQFYPIGLEERELVHRVRENVVRPLCHFTVLDGIRSAEVADACGTPSEDPRVIHVVLGNHDYMSKPSPALQREVVPGLVSNWRVHEGVAEVVQLGGLSLVLFDSMAIFLDPRKGAELASVLAASPGPWRVLAGHQPPINVDSDEWEGPRSPPYGKAVQEAMRSAGVPIHLMLAGHEHNLQLLPGGGDGPALYAIAGGGSNPRGPADHELETLVAEETLGFARIDLVDRPEGRALVVSLLAVDGRWPYEGSIRLLARASVDEERRLRLE